MKRQYLGFCLERGPSDNEPQVGDVFGVSVESGGTVPLRAFDVPGSNPVDYWIDKILKNLIAPGSRPLLSTLDTQSEEPIVTEELIRTFQSTCIPMIRLEQVLHP